jgi:phosphoribosyl 1,2-cyclic phosphodiesterase
VRGSTPCHGAEIARYGGNTSCVSIDAPGQRPILLDLGTGSRYFGVGWPADQPFDGACLLTHLHWDHIQGLPFFTPVLRPGNRLVVHAPVQEDGAPIGEVIERMLCPPLFPVRLDAFPADITFEAHGDESFAIDDVRVESRLVPHVGNTLGFRIEFGGASIAYISDHQQPGIDRYEATDNAKALCAGVDVLIHDAQYTREEFDRKSNWGHCTIEYAAWLASECDAGMLVMYHHDPLHDDDTIDRLVGVARSAVADGICVIGAREGLTLPVGR